MTTTDMIEANEFCIYHNIEISFLQSLQRSGLVAVTVIDEKIFVPASELPQLEKMVRLYYEMDINLEGIETITYLLQRMNDMQKEMKLLKSRLNMYEE